MSDVTITVRGEHEQLVQAEIANATVSVRVEGADRAEVAEQAGTLAKQISDELAALTRSGAVIRSSSDRLSVWSDRPHNNEGKVLPLVHHATVTTRSEFREVGPLSEWVTHLAEREGVSVDDISWALTPQTRNETESVVAQGAVGVAVARATAYANALGLANVSPLEIADQGLLTSPQAESVPRGRAFALASAMSSGSSFELEPKEIRVSATVEARFLAR